MPEPEPTYGSELLSELRSQIAQFVGRITNWAICELRSQIAQFVILPSQQALQRYPAVDQSVKGGPTREMLGE